MHKDPSALFNDNDTRGPYGVHQQSVWQLLRESCKFARNVKVSILKRRQAGEHRYFNLLSKTSMSKGRMPRCHSTRLSQSIWSSKVCEVTQNLLPLPKGHNTAVYWCPSLVRGTCSSRCCYWNVNVCIQCLPQTQRSSWSACRSVSSSTVLQLHWQAYARAPFFSINFVLSLWNSGMLFLKNR